jgi:hypothetical protein
MNPIRLLYLLHLPVRLMRVVTDPIVDLVLFVLNRVLMPVVWRAVFFAAVGADWAVNHVAELIGGVQTIHRLEAVKSKVSKFISSRLGAYMRSISFRIW